MVTEKNLIVRVNYSKTQSITDSEVLDEYYRYLKKGFIDTNITLSVDNIILENNSWSIVEVCNEIFKDIKDVLINQNIEESTIKELDTIYKKHYRYIKKLE